MNRLHAITLVDGSRLSYGIHGSGEPVILIHGTPSHSYIWRNVYPAIAKEGFRVYLFDLLGFGRSERPRDPSVDTSVAAQAKLLRKFLDAWGIRRAHVVAHDIGGAVGMRFSLVCYRVHLSLGNALKIHGCTPLFRPAGHARCQTAR
jgi:pimeloyl-ACP methyl ester carboxylesterase